MFWIPLAIMAGAQILGGQKEKEQKQKQAIDMRERSRRVNAAYATRAEGVRRRSRRIIGEARQVLSSNNVAFEGSVGAMVATSIFEANIDVANTLREGELAGEDMNLEAKYMDISGENAKTASVINAAGTIFGGMSGGGGA